MDMNSIGKFETRRIVNEFDAALIRRFGLNMRDAAIGRYEALVACSEFDCPRQAAEAWGLRHGLSENISM